MRPFASRITGKRLARGDVYRPKAQTAALHLFADRIGAIPRLTKDEAGNPRIDGKNVTVYVQPKTTEKGKEPVFQLYIVGGAQKVRSVISALSLAVSARAGRSSIMVEMKLEEMTVERGRLICQKLGIARRRQLSTATREGLKDRFGLRNPPIKVASEKPVAITVAKPIATSVLRRSSATVKPLSPPKFEANPTRPTTSRGQ
jgi:hypothetical protein